jgi:protein SCO1/2
VKKVGAGGTAFLLAALTLWSWSAPLLAQHDLSLGETREIVPRYLLKDTNGRAVTPDDYRGRFQLITFGYTFCPDICPTTLTEMAAILQQLGPLAEGLQPLFVSLDPERDTPEVLRTYTAFFDPRIIGLTGAPALVSRAAANFKVRYQKVFAPDAPPDRYSVDHSAGMVLLGPDGAYLKKFAYATPILQVAEAIRRQMEEMPAQPQRGGRQ